MVSEYLAGKGDGGITLMYATCTEKERWAARWTDMEVDWLCEAQ